MGNVGFFRGGTLAAGAGLSDMDPVGDAASGSGTAVLDKGFEQHRPNVVTVMPLAG